MKGLKLDSILEDLGVDSIDWIKIDAEGAEGEILTGMQKTIAKSNPLRIIFEANDKECFETCKEILESHRMVIIDVLQNNFLAEKK